MLGARLAIVALVIAGALASPLSFAQGYVGELTADQAQLLDEIRKRMQPQEYSPGNASGCARWKGRALIVRPTPDRLCSSGCELELEDEWVGASRWVVTGKRCERRARMDAPQPRQEQAGATQASQVLPTSREVVLPRYSPPPHVPSLARNRGPGQEIIDGPPPGFRAAPYAGGKR